MKCAMSRPEQEQEQEKQAAKQCKWKASSKIRDAMVSGSPTDGRRADSRTKKGYSNGWLTDWLENKPMWTFLLFGPCLCASCNLRRQIGSRKGLSGEVGRGGGGGG